MLLASLTSSVTSFIAHHGVVAVFLLMMIDAVFPAASEVVLLYAGALASGAFAGQEVTLFGTKLGTGFDAYLTMALAGTLGYLVGALIGWAIGRRGGRPFIERHGRLVHLPPAQIAKAERWFDRFGDWAVFVGRITPLARSFVSIPAGLFEAPLGRYTVLTAIGSAIWSFALVAIGYAVGSNWESIHSALRYVDILVVVAAVALVGWWVLRRRRATRLAPRGDSAD